jgi:peroxiredoxin
MRTFRFLPAVSLVFALTPLFAQSSAQDPSVRAALHESDDFRQRKQLSSALDSARKALKLAKGDCGECYQRMVSLQFEMDRPHDAAASAAAWASHAATPAEKAMAEYTEARALVLDDHEKHNDSLLKRADQVLTEAAIDNPTDPAIHLLQGRVLVALKRDTDAKSQFQACMTTPGATPLQCRRASAYAQNLTLTTNDEAPEFTITRADGAPVTLESLAGKVVLIDFWATWCGPCAHDLDYVQSIAEEFEKNNFVLLGISTDENEAAWKNHVAENRMIGIQVRDSKHNLNDTFHVAGIPTYVILDGNGIIRYRSTGAGKDLRDKVREVIKESNSYASAKQVAASSVRN